MRSPKASIQLYIKHMKINFYYPSKRPSIIYMPTSLCYLNVVESATSLFDDEHSFRQCQAYMSNT